MGDLINRQSIWKNIGNGNFRILTGAQTVSKSYDHRENLMFINEILVLIEGNCYYKVFKLLVDVEG